MNLTEKHRLETVKSWQKKKTAEGFLPKSIQNELKKKKKEETPKNVALQRKVKKEKAEKCFGQTLFFNFNLSLT